LDREKLDFANSLQYSIKAVATEEGQNAVVKNVLGGNVL